MTAKSADYPTANHGFGKLEMTGNQESYGDQCKAGRREADLLISNMQNDRNPMLLCARVRQILDSGKFAGFEIGLFHRVAEHLIKS